MMWSSTDTSFASRGSTGFLESDSASSASVDGSVLIDAARPRPSTLSPMSYRRRRTASVSLGRRARAVCISTAALMSLVSCGGGTAGPSPTTVNANAPTTAPTSGAIVNTWKSSTVDPKKLRIGDSKVSTTTPAIGALWACRAGNPNAGGASKDGPWLNSAAGTWDSTNKLAVEGMVSWPQVAYSETVSAGSRTLRSNDLPVDGQTGTFPIAKTDPSYAYDRNPGTVQAQSTTLVLEATPTIASSPSCLPEGPVAMLRNGVTVFSSLDGKNLDAVAHESQDVCQGHPAMTTYHYHNVPSCIRNATSGSSTVVGWARDGFPITVERDPSGALPSNADLDLCHGRVSDIVVDGRTVTMYHYSATLEFPYFMGCFKGTPIATSR